MLNLRKSHAPLIGRRAALLGLSAAWSFGGASLAFGDAPMLVGPRDPRLVIVLLRGALDGMSAVVPYGDPALASLRGPLVGAPPGQPGGLLDLGGFYGLHPALAGMYGMYRANELLAVHAVAGATRSRSHFDAQDSLESGAEHRLNSGWLNRAALAFAQSNAGGRGLHDAAASRDPMALGVTVPLLLQGPAKVGSYAPDHTGRPSPDLYARIAALSGSDRLLGGTVAEGLRLRTLAETGMQDPMAMGAGGRPGAPDPYARNPFAQLAAAGGRLLGRPDGPRLAAMEIGGWDTHAGQASRLSAPLAQLDQGLVVLRDSLGPEAWGRTVVVAMTEFGRTARINGTQGTDHGTGGVAFLAGGAIQGGRVGGDWPGLGAGKLYQDRDLAPTTDLRALLKGVLAGHLGITDRGALNRIFPGSDGIGPTTGLLRA
ncbi:uncharacterized protein (DUF1501 family) [Endobacter medicaginis]|jgi:uncharacterized protein (DUF1501 family)|uniref:Uncharacterized protein (DUF1501 family) n=3 Tax=Endobacter medicaginis TaxID=1181271 RepID=A0A839USE6_9PROT|nr:DUF1501 domain-containing protein [Endobacter medicaginis]MBB3172706.1 uncharacterized protein (DUF1501 family) [Endobacter medicaginis]MCX5474313.1 DUF1501 domain-containing protein [Endobacter medicaginis]